MKSQVLKLYGLTKDEIVSASNSLEFDHGKVFVTVKEKYKDAYVVLETKNDNCDEEFQKALSAFAVYFSKQIYADSDISLYERLYQFLSVKNLTICLAEQGTGGIITQNLMTFDKAEKHVKASYVLPSIKQMIDHFDLNPFKITANRGVCGEIAFDIASHIRARIPADLYVVSLSTLAEGNELYYNGNEIAYVAIGTTHGVNMLKIENCGGTKRDFMNQVAKTICFKLINILK